MKCDVWLEKMYKFVKETKFQQVVEYNRGLIFLYFCHIFFRL